MSSPSNKRPSPASPDAASASDSEPEPKTNAKPKAKAKAKPLKKPKNRQKLLKFLAACFSDARALVSDLPIIFPVHIARVRQQDMQVTLNLIRQCLVCLGAEDLRGHKYKSTLPDYEVLAMARVTLLMNNIPTSSTPAPALASAAPAAAGPSHNSDVDFITASNIRTAELAKNPCTETGPVSYKQAYVAIEGSNTVAPWSRSKGSVDSWFLAYDKVVRWYIHIRSKEPPQTPSAALAAHFIASRSPLTRNDKCDAVALRTEIEECFADVRGQALITQNMLGSGLDTSAVHGQILEHVLAFVRSHPDYALRKKAIVSLMRVANGSFQTACAMWEGGGLGDEEQKALMNELTDAGASEWPQEYTETLRNA